MLVGGLLVWTVADQGGADAAAAPDLTSEPVPVADPTIAAGHCDLRLLPLASVRRVSVRVHR